MEKYKWILGSFIPIAAVPIMVIALIVFLKLLERLLGKLYRKLDEKVFVDHPLRKPHPIVVNITKIIFDILVGLIVFSVCVRILTLPVYILIAIKGADWTPPLFIIIPLIVIPYFFSGLTTFKVIQYIHRNLDLTINMDKQDIKT